MAVSKKTKALYNAVFDGFELCAANTIQKVQERRLLKKMPPRSLYRWSMLRHTRNFGVNMGIILRCGDGTTHHEMEIWMSVMYRIRFIIQKLTSISIEENLVGDSMTKITTLKYSLV